ncbi:ribosome-recycling factor, mitochondrial-like [Babylonia areolata]|uniref:ribosome-recycling factor, mitochondrial-like n=1 Tax=Babylonia areolata TaxID=304850 RepID=UPI003FD43A6D
MAARSLTTVLSCRGFLSGKAFAVHSGLASASCGAVHKHFYSHRAHHPLHRRASFGRTQLLLCNTERMRRASGTGGLFQPEVHSPLSWCVARGYAKKSKKEKVAKGGKKKVTLSAEELDGVLDLSRLQEEMMSVAEDLKMQMIQQVSIRTNIGVYDNLPVKTDDGVFPLVQLGQVVQKNPTLILVNMASSPQYIKAVKDALTGSGLNVNPQQEGTTIFIPVPKITREHREGLAKNAKMIHDKAKTRLRDIHNKFVKKVKAAKDHHSEDIVRAAQDLVLEEMHSHGQQLDAMLAAKQQELLGGK